VGHFDFLQVFSVRFARHLEAVARDLCDVFRVEADCTASAKMWNRARFGRPPDCVGAKAKYSGKLAGAQ
jgi:hypothetical protein